MEKKTLKVVLLGDSNVGKTSIINRYVKNEFSVSTMATVSGGLTVKELDISKNKVEIQIWDTAGQERFSSLSRLFFRNCHACVIVFDLTQPRTFDSVEKWKTQFIEYGAYENGKIPPIFLVGNKLDMKKSSKVTLNQMERTIHDLNLYEEAFKISASKDIDVAQLFQTVSLCAFHYEKTLNEPESSENINLNKNPQNEEGKSSCCF